MAKTEMAPKPIPKQKLDTLARAALAAVREAFEHPETAAEYERWLAERKEQVNGTD